VPFTIILRVPGNAKSISCGMYLKGPGSFYATGLTLQVLQSNMPTTGSTTSG